MEGREFSSSPPADILTASYASLKTQRIKKKKNTKRFSDDQIRLLESMFKLETKLEPKKKLQLASELELQPRQVAIWFQNRRARWKSKKLEQEYRLLKANYDNLNSQFESLKEEKHSLQTQLQKLKETHSTSKVTKVLEGRSTHRGLDDEDTNSDQLKAKTITFTDRLDHSLIMNSDDDERGNTGYPPQYEEPELLSLCEQLDGSLTPTHEKWCNFHDSSGISNSNWWEF